MGPSIQLNEQALAAYDNQGKALGKLYVGNVRTFRVNQGDYAYEVIFVQKEAVPEGISFGEPMPVGTPSYGECAEVIAHLFQEMLKPPEQKTDRRSNYYYGRDGKVLGKIIYEDVSEREEGPGPDMEAGWDAYRTHLVETHSSRLLPAWNKLPSEVQEAFAVGVWAVMDPYIEKLEEGRPGAKEKSLAQWAEESMAAIQGGMGRQPFTVIHGHVPGGGKTMAKVAYSGFVSAWADSVKGLEVLAGRGVEELASELLSLPDGVYTFDQMASMLRAEDKQSRMKLGKALEQLVGTPSGGRNISREGTISNTIDGRNVTRRGVTFYTYRIGGAA